MKVIAIILLIAISGCATPGGWVEFSYYPPHNEYDPNPHIPFKERVVARYSIEAYAESGGNVFLFANPLVLFGDGLNPWMAFGWIWERLKINESWADELGGEFWNHQEELSQKVTYGYMEHIDHLSGLINPTTLFWAVYDYLKEAP